MPYGVQTCKVDRYAPRPPRSSLVLQRYALWMRRLLRLPVPFGPRTVLIGSALLKIGQ